MTNGAASFRACKSADLLRLLTTPLTCVQSIAASDAASLQSNEATPAEKMGNGHAESRAQRDAVAHRHFTCTEQRGQRHCAALNWLRFGLAASVLFLLHSFISFQCRWCSSEGGSRSARLCRPSQPSTSKTGSCLLVAVVLNLFFTRFALVRVGRNLRRPRNYLGSFLVFVGFTGLCIWQIVRAFFSFFFCSSCVHSCCVCLAHFVVVRTPTASVTCFNGQLRTCQTSVFYFAFPFIFPFTFK